MIGVEWGKFFPKNIVFRIPFSEKGQVSAPFELLVAVIIMGFVIIIGTVMMKSASDAVCLNTVDSSMTVFKNYLEDTANRRGSHKFDFRPQQCFNPTKASIKITKVIGGLRCSSQCGIPSNTCFVMTFSAPDLANGFNEKCLNIPAFTSFLDTPAQCLTSSDNSLDGFNVIKPEEGIPLGTYIFRNMAASAEPYPKICMYQK